MKLKILVSAFLLAPLGLASAVRAENPASLKQLLADQPCATCQTSIAQPLLLAQLSWQPISSSEGHFAVQMPGKPTEDKRDGHSFTVQTQQGVFMVAYKDFPDEVGKTSADKYLDQVSEGLGTDGDKVVSQRKITLAGYPGRELRYQTSDGMDGIARIYLVKERIYTVIVMPSKLQDAQKFLDSFRLTQ